MTPRLQRTAALVFLTLLAAAGLVTPLRAATVVKLGTVKQFTGPADPNLDLAGFFEYAVNFSADDPARTVAGVTFKPDNRTIPGAAFLGPQNVTPWQTRPEYGSSADANALEEIMADIRWANYGSGEKLQATLAVLAGVRYKIQILISGNTAENRRWDIRLNGQQAVDEITSLGASPGNTYAVGRSTVWACEFVPSGTTAVVEMGTFFGGNDGGDRNPIWQALTLERIEFPPAPDDLTLSSGSFFPSQTLPVGTFAVTDRKYSVTHTLSLVSGEGSADNAKFTLTADGRLLAAPFDFSGQTPGAVYSIRVRAADRDEPARQLEKVFTLTLAAPHAPTAVTLDPAFLTLGSIPGQSAGRLSAADPDSFDRHVFSLVPGAGDSHNAAFTIDGNTLLLAAAPSAGVDSVSLRVRAVDLAGLAVESVLILPVVEPRVRINEVLAVPTAASRPLDQNGDPRDWIELHNPGARPVSLAGWHLSDDPEVPDQWTFPATASIPAGGYYLVFADGTGEIPENGPPHTTFSLSGDGERLTLSRPDGLAVSTVTMPRMYPNVAWGHGVLDTEITWLMSPTPGAANAHIAAAGSVEVLFSVPHGFKTAAFPLTLTSTFPGSVIRYTLDGSKPGPASPVYSAPLTITPAAGTVKSGTRIVRAMATHLDIPWSPVTTQSYFFVNGVTAPLTDGMVGQSNFFSSIRNHAVYGPLLDDALLALPAVSLVINGSSGLPLAETESSLELFDPQGREEGFTVPAGVIRSGTSSLNFAKGSMSARFRGEYGAGRLDYPVYAGHPHDAAGAATSFQELRLRSGSHDTLSWLGTADNPGVPYGSPAVTRGGDAQFVRNIWIEDTQLLMGQPGKHGRMVNMFVNGNYYGMYHIQEHADDDYMASYYPGNSDDWHFTGGGTTGSEHANGESWRSVWSELKASLGNYAEARRWVDVTNLADYMVLSFYIGNDWDWTTLHNWGAAGPRLPDRGGWKFFEQDQDVSLQDVNADSTDQTAPDGIFNALMAHADFKVLFRDRIYRHLFNNGVLTPAKASGYYQLRTGEISTAIVAETARWQPSSSAGPLPWDRDGEWTVEKNYLVNTFFPQRTAKLLTQLRARGWYPVNAPEMTPRGGAADPGSQVLLTGPAGAALYYTLDGSDPRLPGGAVNPAARPYTATLGSRTLVEAHDGVTGRGAVWKYLAPAADPGETWKNTAYDDSAWASGAASLGYGGGEVTDVGGADTDPVTPGEQRNLTTYFRRAFPIENPSAVTGLNLRLKRDDGAVVYLNGREIFRSAMPAGAIGFTTPGNGGVNVPDDGGAWFSKALVPADYTLAAGTNVIAVEVHNAFSGSGDLAFDLELTATLPVAAQPIVLNAAAVLKTRALIGSEWSGLNEAAFVLTGTQPAGAGNVVISEIHYHPEGDGQGDNEFVEFLNTSAAPAAMDGARLGGGVTLTFPPGLVLAPGERVVAVKDAALFDARYRTPGSPSYHAGIRVAGVWEGSLSNGGESLSLTAADGQAAFTMAWGDSGSWPGAADGKGPSLELRDPAAAPVTTAADKGTWLSLGGNWRASAEPHGTPGYAGSDPGVSGYGAWAATAFPGSAPAADQEKTADPDRDGLVNLLEFALGRNPLSPDLSPLLLSPPGSGAGNAGEFPEFHFTRRADAAGLAVRVQVSPDLAVWDSSEAEVERISEKPDPDGTVRVTARLLPAAVPAAGDRRYLRLAVSF